MVLYQPAHVGCVVHGDPAEGGLGSRFNAMNRVFGYGSLINARTHGYEDLRVATLADHRRVWRHSTLRQVAFLSVEAASGWQIDGLLASVPETEWSALDHRERAYVRRDVADQTRHDGPAGPVIVYEVAPGHAAPPDTAHPILLSYIDTVVEGVLDHFGIDGVQRFADSTTGWQAPILDDRGAPVYPRHTAPGPEVTTTVDRMLALLDCKIETGTTERLDSLRSHSQV